MELTWDWIHSCNGIVKLALVDFFIQWILWAIAAYFKTEKFYDVAGSGTFVILIILIHQWNGPDHPRQFIQSFCITLWAFRLGLFLFTRILKAGSDRRFDKIKVSPFWFFCTWTVQGIWVFLTLLPSLIVLQARKQRPVTLRDYVGWSIWVIGFLIEVVADYQKTVFRNNPANKDKFISSGLWSMSRHPNYLGEIMLWFGLYVSASATFTGLQYLTVFCPVLDYLLITRVSGIPLLEKYGLRKWGALPQYQEYLKNTPPLVPFYN